MLVAEALLLPRHSRGFIWLLPTKKALPQQCFFVAEMGECHSCTQHPVLLQIAISAASFDGDVGPLVVPSPRTVRYRAMAFFSDQQSSSSLRLTAITEHRAAKRITPTEFARTTPEQPFPEGSLSLPFGLEAVGASVGASVSVSVSTGNASITPVSRVSPHSVHSLCRLPSTPGAGSVSMTQSLVV